MRKFVVYFALWYLRFFARIQLAKFKPVIVGVGGASGKTSLVNFIAQIASQKFKILETKGKNSETGIPLSVLGLQIQDYTLLAWIKILILVPFKVIFDWRKYDILIAEMGIDGPKEPKNMSYLLKIITPRIGVLTNISYEHSLYFEEITKNKEEILALTAKEEQKLLKKVSKNGLVVLNLDDPSIRDVDGIVASKFTISAKEISADFFIEKIDVSLERFIVSFFFESKKYLIEIPTALPDHYAYSLVMAIVVCKSLGINIEDSIKILQKKFSLPPGRMSIFKGKKDTLIIDSSYNNATITPIVDILDLLKRVGGYRRKVAIIGDMRELGVVEKTIHEKVAKKILSTTDIVILVGPLMKKFVAPLLRKNKHNFYSFSTFSEAKSTIGNVVKRGDLVLVKSSQNTLFLERAVEMLLKNPKDKNKLARRGRFWDKIRSQNP